MYKLLVLLCFLVSNSWASPDDQDISASYSPAQTAIFLLKSDPDSDDSKCVSEYASDVAASPEFFLLTGIELSPVYKSRFSLPPSRASPFTALI
jgi:hypothetical protein